MAGLGTAIPWLPHGTPLYLSSFDTNIGIFVKNYGQPVPLPSLPSVSCWVITLQGAQTTLQLHVYKERLGEDTVPICDQCRIIGWQNHPVSRHKYHFVVPVYEGVFVTAHTPEESAAFPMPEAYSAPPSAFDSHAHLLHGVIHANGFGHLARVNGREGGSNKLTGKQLMQIWDSLCHLLRARQISVEDVSNKGGMELRVLHAAAHKTTWYGQWGYQYGRGAFNITQNKWKKAMEAVHRAKLLLLLADFSGVKSSLPAIVARYKAVEADCNTLGALLKAMLGLLSKPQAAADLFAQEAQLSASTSTEADTAAATIAATAGAPVAATVAGGHQPMDAGTVDNGKQIANCVCLDSTTAQHTVSESAEGRRSAVESKDVILSTVQSHVAEDVVPGNLAAAPQSQFASQISQESTQLAPLLSQAEIQATELKPELKHDLSKEGVREGQLGATDVPSALLNGPTAEGHLPSAVPLVPSALGNMPVAPQAVPVGTGAGPSVSAAGPSLLAAGPPSLTTGPSLLAAGPSSLAAGPSSLAAAPSSLAAGPSLLAAGPSTLGAGPSSWAAPPSTLAAGPPSQEAGPSLLAAAPTEQSQSATTASLCKAHMAGRQLAGATHTPTEQHPSEGQAEPLAAADLPIEKAAAHGRRASDRGKEGKPKGGPKEQSLVVKPQLTGRAALALAVMEAGDRTASTKKRKVLGQNMLPMPASRLAYDMSDLEAISLQNHPKRWSLERCNNCLTKVMGALTPYEGWWVSRSLARDQVHKHMGDTGMMDYMLKAIANRTVGPWAVFRRTDPSDKDKMLFYLVVKKDGSTALPAADAIYPHPAAHSLPPTAEAAAQSGVITLPPAAAAAAGTKAATQSAVMTHPVAAAAATTKPAGMTQPASAVEGAPASAALPADVAPASPAILPQSPIVSPLQESASLIGGSPPPQTAAPLPQTASPAPQAAAPPPQAASLLPQAAPPLPQAASSPPQAAAPLPRPASPPPQAASPPPQAAWPQLQAASPQLQPPNLPLDQTSSGPQVSQRPGPSEAHSEQQSADQQLLGNRPETSKSHDIGDQFLALLQNASSQLAGTQQLVSHTPADLPPHAADEGGVYGEEEDCTAGWLHDHPVGSSPVHQPQLDQGIHAQPQVSQGIQAELQLSQGLLTQPQSPAQALTLALQQPSSCAPPLPLSQTVSPEHVQSGLQPLSPPPSSPPQSPAAVHSSPAGSSSPATAPAGRRTPARQTGLKGVLGEACSNIIAQHRARRTPTHSRVAVWPPVQLVSPQSASLSPSSASQLSGQPALQSNLASQSSGQTQETGQPTTSLEHLHQPALAAPISALQSSEQPAFAAPSSALQSSGQPALASHNSALQSSGQPAFAAPSSAFHSRPQETVQELSSPQYQHQDQPAPSQSLLGAHQVPNAVTQQHYGEQLPDQQAWYHYLNAQPESAHECEEVQGLHAPGVPPASYSASESQLSAQNKANLGVHTEQGGLPQAADLSSQAQLPSALSQPPSCHNLDTSTATDTEHMVPVQNRGAAAADDDDAARQEPSLQAQPALHTTTQQADIHPSAGLHHPQHAQQEQAAEGLEAQHAQQESAATAAPGQLVSLPDAQQTRQDHEGQMQDVVQQPVESSMEVAHDKQQLPDAAIATTGQPNQRLNAKHVVQSHDAQPATSQQLPDAQEAQQAQQPPEAQQAQQPPEAQQAQQPPEAQQAQQPPEAQQAQQPPEAQQAQQPPEAQQAQRASNAAAQAECNDGVDNVWQADQLQPYADTVMLEVGHAQQDDASSPFETQHAQHGSHTNPQEARYAQQQEAGTLFKAQHAQQAPDSMNEALSDGAVHEAQHAQQGGVSSDAERSNLQPTPAGVQDPQLSKMQVDGHAEAEEEEHSSLSDKAQPALKRSHRKQPKRFQKKRVVSAAALKPAGSDKGIASDNKGIAGDDKGIAGGNTGGAGDDKGIAGSGKGIAGSDKGIADETASASKRSGALANKPASAVGAHETAGTEEEEAEETELPAEPQPQPQKNAKKTKKKHGVPDSSDAAALHLPEAARKKKKLGATNPSAAEAAPAAASKKMKCTAPDSIPAEASPEAAKTQKKKKLAALDSATAAEAAPEAAVTVSSPQQRRRTRHSGMATMDPLPDPDIMLRAETRTLLATASEAAPLHVTPAKQQRHDTEAGQNQSHSDAKPPTEDASAAVVSDDGGLAQKQSRTRSGLSQGPARLAGASEAAAAAVSPGQKKCAGKSGLTRSQAQPAEGSTRLPEDHVSPRHRASSSGRRAQCPPSSSGQTQTPAPPLYPKRESRLRRMTQPESWGPPPSSDPPAQLQQSEAEEEEQEKVKVEAKAEAGSDHRRRSSRHMNHPRDDTHTPTDHPALQAEPPHEAPPVVLTKRKLKSMEKKSGQQATTGVVLEPQAGSVQKQQRLGKGKLQAVDPVKHESQHDPGNGKRKRVSVTKPLLMEEEEVKHESQLPLNGRRKRTAVVSPPLEEEEDSAPRAGTSSKSLSPGLAGRHAQALHARERKVKRARTFDPASSSAADQHEAASSQVALSNAKRAKHAKQGAQHTSKAKSWKLHSAGPPGMPHPAPPHPLSPSLGQGRLMAKSNIAPTAILKTGAPSGFDNPAEWTSDHLESGSIQASTARRRSESSQARMRKGVDVHTDQKHGASLVESESSQGRMRKGVHLHTDQKHGASLVESESSQGRVRKGVDVHSDPQSEPWTSPVGSSRLHTKAKVDYHEGVKRRRGRGGAGNARHRGTHSRTAPPLALAVTQPPVILIPQPWQALHPGTPFPPQHTPHPLHSGPTPRDQVLCDLVYLFNNVLRCYAPAVGREITPQPSVVTDSTGQLVFAQAAAGVLGTVAEAAPNKAVGEVAVRRGALKLGQLAADVQALRDVKHFVKDYKGHMLPADHTMDQGGPRGTEASASSPEGIASSPDISARSPGASSGRPGQVRLLLQVQLPEEATTPLSLTPHPSSSSAAARVMAAEMMAGVRGMSLPPPVEPLLVPRRAPLGQVKKAAQQHMADIYTMLEHWQVTELTGLEHSELRAKVGNNVADNTLVSVSGDNMDLAPCWRHAGGFEDWVVSCRCGTRVDDGERMVACDVCGVWMHTRCQGMPDADPIPDECVCSKCAKLL